MSYQFSIERPSASVRFPALIMAAVVCAVIATYTVAACGDRSPDQAAAGEPIVTTPAGAVPVTEGPVSFEMADSAYRARRYDDATALFHAYVERRPTNPWGFYMLGLSAWKSGERAEAESAFVQALAIDSTHVKSHINLSRVLLEGGQPERALVHVETAIRLDSTSSEPLRLLGRAYDALGKTDDAIVAYQRAIVQDDGDFWAINNLGALSIRLGRFEDALGPIARAIELEGNVATFHNNLGMALEQTGRFAAAADAYRAALAIEGTYGKAAANLARVETVKQDSAIEPVDLGERIKQFQAEVDRWRQPPVQ